MAQEALRYLIQTYHELNPSSIDEMSEEPSPLEFMRYVARNRPFVVRGGARQWKACRLWKAEYLISVMQNQLVNVALTPLGNADAPHAPQDPKLPPLCFVKPYERDEPFDEVLGMIQRLEKGSGVTDFTEEPVRYAQTQNDNLRNEYVDLFKDVPKDIPFARIALQKGPDAINFWLGNSHSTTALHKDNYENIYVQILGRKHFVLLPPLCAPCINEQYLPAATYHLHENDQQQKPNTTTPPPIAQSALTVTLDNPASTVPFATWDPDSPDSSPTPWSALAQPMRVSLDEGDMLYLPAMWYHKVTQSCSDEGLCCAVNYWYDMDFTGSFFPTSSFVRDVALLLPPPPPSSSQVQQNTDLIKEKK